jgi:alpha-beta hydrolase superfamily lysophospholipase
MALSSSVSEAADGPVGLRHDESPLVRRATPGPTLYFSATFPAEGIPRAVVGLLPGFADHGARYAHVARAWAERGLATIAIDLRGHGRAEGPRGGCDRFREYSDDVAELAQLVHERADHVPAFLFGHSFGGLVATFEAIASPSRWRGLLLTAPNFRIAVKVPALKLLAGRVASRVAPSFSFPAGIHGAELTHDPAMARSYDQDPLVFKNVRSRWFVEMLDAQRQVMANAASLKIPLYMAMGTLDPVADFATAKVFFDAAGSYDKTWDPCEGLFHEVLNEPEWPAIARRMADWMITRS